MFPVILPTCNVRPSASSVCGVCMARELLWNARRGTPYRLIPTPNYHLTGTPQVRSMVLARPELLAAKPHELERCLRFVYGSVGGDRDTVLRCPLLLARPLGQVLGPRYRYGGGRGAACAEP